ncbi:MAG: hypothetical protein ACRD0U_14790, partial [Acidimicrobiales bacterium]
MTEERERKNPLEQAIDVLFYAPLGLLMNIDEVVPQLIERGRQQVQMARMFGEMTFQHGPAEARKEAQKLRNRVQSGTAGIVEQLAGLAGARRPDGESEGDTV